MKAPIGRIGGKFRLSKRLVALFPNNYESYIEPFIGGGSVFYRSKKVGKEVINDLDTDIYLIHKGLRDEDGINERFRRELTKEEFIDIRNKTDTVSLLEKYKHSFMAKGEFYQDRMKNIGKVDKNGRPCYRKKCTTDFSVYKPRLEGVIIKNEDYKDIIKEYDDENAFFYLDPPYENSKKSTGGAYIEIDYNELVDILKQLKGKFILSINDSKNIRELFKDFKIQELETKYVGLNQSKGGATIKTVELVIMNF